MIKQFLKFILLELFVFSLLYCLFSFYSVSFNIIELTSETRRIVVALMLVITFPVTVFCINDEPKEKK